MKWITDDSMYITSIVLSYWFVSISMVYLNKVLMSNEGLSIPAPLFVTWYQCVVTTVICWIGGILGERANRLPAYDKVNTMENGEAAETNASKPSKKSFFAQFPKAEYKDVTAKQVFPLSLIFVGMVTFNNLCLKYVEVSFYNVARSLTIVFNVGFTFCILGMPSSPKTIVCLLVVISGFLLGSWGELNLSLYGSLAGIMSSLFVSLNSIFTKKILPVVDNNHWRLTFYNNVNASLLFVPLVAYFEKDMILAAYNQLHSAAFWAAMTVAGVFGFAIGIVTVLQIKATSPLTHNISGTAKAAIQSLLAFYLWKNPATVSGVFGIFTVLGGSLLYTYVKMTENNAAKELKESSETKNLTSSTEMTSKA
mmetsp:Transcript_30609/g.45297  ORF Transcript_30609/g.45297 Transcript_30609/m.45297 type:complete len:366 (-) Transcript_30609:138-1235(-)